MSPAVAEDAALLAPLAALVMEVLVVYDVHGVNSWVDTTGCWYTSTQIHRRGRQMQAQDGREEEGEKGQREGGGGG